MSKYQKPAELYDGLRLHQNENTGGCSLRVIEALAALRPEEIGFYPPYEAATRRANVRRHVMRIDRASGSCSACAMRSAAIHSAGPVAATITISVGPA